MRIGNARDHGAFSPKPRNMSARFASISSAEGAGPYLASRLRPVLNGWPGCSSSVPKSAFENLPRVPGGVDTLLERACFERRFQLLG